MARGLELHGGSTHDPLPGSHTGALLSPTQVPELSPWINGKAYGVQPLGTRLFLLFDPDGCE